jgi:hypothetical protein
VTKKEGKECVNLLMILQERCDTDKLEVLTLLGISGKVRAEPDIFIPLQAYHNLTWLSIKRGCDISMSDEELYQLVRDWPKLKVLKISCCNPFEDTIMPTLLYSYTLKFVTPSQGEQTEPILCDSHTQIEVIELKL